MIEFFEKITFVYPWLLAATILPLGYFVYSWTKGKKPDLLLPTTPIVSVSERTNILIYVPFFLKALGFALFIVALARPQVALEEQTIKGEGIDIMLVMDLSGSMEAKDFKPNRLEVSKRVANAFVDYRKNDRIGLTLFGKNAFTISPLTIDHSVIKKRISELRTGILDDGTAIGMGLATSLNRLRTSESKSKIAILLTDGENNSGEIEPLTAADIANEMGVKVYTIGMGSNSVNNGFFFDIQSNGVDEDLLRKIAAQTGGRYFRAETEDGLQKVYREIDRLEKSQIEINVFKKYSEKYRIFLWIGLLLFLIGYLLRFLTRPLLSV